MDPQRGKQVLREQNCLACHNVKGDGGRTAPDLYLDVVKPATEWPTNDQSIKTLAKYLGFAWRDNNPSGAASIEWFDQWVRTRDPEIRQRILDYNEDDCKATRVLLDGVRSLA